MKLAVYRWLGANAGDEAAQYALASAFGSDVEWVPVDLWEQPENAIAAVNDCDGLVVGGGTILGNLPTWLVAESVLPEIRVPIGLFGTGVRDEGRLGIDDALAPRVAGIVARAHPRGVRGPLSAELLQQLGPSCPPVTIVGDPALLVGSRGEQEATRMSLGAFESHTEIGVNVRVRRDGGETLTVQMLRDYFAGAGRHLRSEVRFFACDREWDPRAAAACWAPLEPYRDLPSFLRWIGARRLIVSERLHGAVVAHAFGIPAVLIAYERKCWDYARSIGLVTSCVAPGDTRALADAVENAAADLEGARPTIARLARDLQTSIDGFRARVRRAKHRRPATLPARARRRPGDGRTLIGLLMVRDEADVLAEALRNHARFCDAIFVLDGTDGPGRALSHRVAMACPKVREYWRDEDIALQLPLRDGARQFLLERARLRYGRGNWYAILHGDEIWGEDPRPYLDVMPSSHDVMAVRFFHFFPHTSQIRTWNFGAPGASGASIEALARWYMLPAISEERVFWDAGHADYEVARHACTVPRGLATWQSECIVKQYNYRSPDQSYARARQRRRDGWQENHYQHLLDGPDGFFRDSLDLPDGQWAASVAIGVGIATSTDVHPLKTWRPARRSAIGFRERLKALYRSRLRHTAGRRLRI